MQGSWRAAAVMTPNLFIGANVGQQDISIDSSPKNRRHYRTMNQFSKSS